MNQVVQEARDLLVPNLPCGVEKNTQSKRKDRLPLVPNLPCGVENLRREVEA